ncbi:MAG: ARMT1-like domain-containing protein [Sulfolobales archaeon]|nr:ARMT1-like domain-containing protein [Sulfolobales archaeon]
MKYDALCIQCILQVRLREINSALSNGDRAIELSLKIVEYALKLFKEGCELTHIAGNTYSLLAKASPEVVNYYRVAKRNSIAYSWSVIKDLDKYIKDLKDLELFKALIKISIAGNAIDMGVFGHEFHGISLENAILRELAIDHTVDFYNYVKAGGKKILWLFDNAGEAVFDLPLIDELRRLGNRVVGLVKEEPGFQNDLSINDLNGSGVVEHLDEVLSTGYSGSTIYLNEISSEAKRALNESNIVVAKGMSHYEYLIDVDLGKPVLHLLIPKCEVIARTVGVPKGSFVALLRL